MPPLSPAIADLSFLAEGWAQAFGNLSATSTSEVLICARGYAEPASEAQRSVVSTSDEDQSGGSGVVKVELIYLTSDYVLKSEVIELDGITPVNTVATDIRFVEKFHAIEGVAAAGAVKLMSATSGGGSEVAGIGAYTETAFLCHHYVPAGKQAYLICWGASADRPCKFKLKTQARYAAGGLVDENCDLYNLVDGGVTYPATREFAHELCGIPIGEKTHFKVTVVPQQTDPTVVRARIRWWEYDIPT